MRRGLLIQCLKHVISFDGLPTSGLGQKGTDSILYPNEGNSFVHSFFHPFGTHEHVPQGGGSFDSVWGCGFGVLGLSISR